MNATKGANMGKRAQVIHVADGNFWAVVKDGKLIGKAFSKRAAQGIRRVYEQAARGGK